MEMFKNEVWGACSAGILKFDWKGWTDGDEEAAEGSRVRLMWVDASTDTVVKCLKEKKTRRRRHRKLYLNNFGRMLNLAMEQILRNFGRFAEY